MALFGLLRLPLELRQAVYAHFMPQETVVHPLPGVGLTSVSCRPPPLSLLLIHPQVTEEVVSYFFGLARWKLVFSHDFNFFRVDPNLSQLENSPCLKSLQKVEIVFFCDILLLNDYPSFGLGRFCAEIRKKAERASRVLSLAPHLRSVTVSWIDTTQTSAWEHKARVLEPLKALASPKTGGGAVFTVGDVYGPENLDRAAFMTALRDAVGDEAVVVGGPNVLSATPSRLRMLAFDVKQEACGSRAIITRTPNQAICSGALGSTSNIA